MYHILIGEIPIELHVVWPSDTERRFKLTFSEFVSLSLKIRLMTLLNMPQEMILRNYVTDPMQCITSQGYISILRITLDTQRPV